MTPERLHVPDTAMDQQLLEAARPTATALLDAHYDIKHRNNWNIEEVLNTDTLVKLLPYRQEVRLSEGVGEAVEVFLWTEDGITYYPRDVGKIFNPANEAPKDSDPFNVFPRVWASEEFQHTLAGREIARLIGRDMIEIEAVRNVVIQRGNVPRPQSSALGIAYTGIQESNTSGPYQKLVDKFKGLGALAAADGNEPIAEIDTLAANVYSEIAQDERLHRKFITGVGKIALWSGDNGLAEYMLSAVYDTLNKFQMPLQMDILRGINRNKKPGDGENKAKDTFGAIQAAGIFTDTTVAESQLYVIDKIWKIPSIPKLSGRAADIQEKISYIIDNRKHHSASSQE